MENIYTKLLAVFLAILQIGNILCLPLTNESPASSSLFDGTRHQLSKRGAGRAFRGFYNFGSLNGVDSVATQPYYLYEKRGGGRSFNHNADLYRFDKRGGGRAFAGSWSPYLEPFYDNKRSGYPIYFTDNY